MQERLGRDVRPFLHPLQCAAFLEAQTVRLISTCYQPFGVP